VQIHCLLRIIILVNEAASSTVPNSIDPEISIWLSEGHGYWTVIIFADRFIVFTSL